MGFQDFFSGLAGHFVQEVDTGNPVADKYTRWIGKLLQNVSRWTTISSAGIKCTVQLKDAFGIHSCGASAIGSCFVCGSPVCFSHAMIGTQDGNLICLGCVHVAKQSIEDLRQKIHDKNREVPNTQVIDKTEEIKKNLKTLGLSDSPSVDDIKQAYKNLAFKNHPDRFPESKRDSAKKKLSKINIAYEWLMKNYSDAA